MADTKRTERTPRSAAHPGEGAIPGAPDSNKRTPRSAAHPGEGAIPNAPDSDKRTERTTVHLTPAELAYLDQERIERVKNCPGAVMSRSALLVQVLREYRQRQADQG